MNAVADAGIDNRVLDLYGITDAADRARVLGSAPVMEEVELEDDLALAPSPSPDEAE